MPTGKFKVGELVYVNLDPNDDDMFFPLFHQKVGEIYEIRNQSLLGYSIRLNREPAINTAHFAERELEKFMLGMVTKHEEK
jgi:ribosomal protein L21E